MKIGNEKRRFFLGVPFDDVDKAQTIEIIEEAVKKEFSIPFYRADLNVNTVVEAQDNGLIKDYISNADLINVDGMGVIFGCKLFSVKPPERVTGVDLFYDLLQLANKNKNSVYFLGATQKTIEQLVFMVSKNFPDINICGSQNGYFNGDFEAAISNINKAKPDLLFIGMKSPEKEMLAYRYQKDIHTKVIIGVGGTFDVYTGKVERAPKWVQNLGFEWLFRVYQEPKRMWKRYLLSNSRFLILLIKRLLNKS